MDNNLSLPTVYPDLHVEFNLKIYVYHNYTCFFQICDLLVLNMIYDNYMSNSVILL
jgi:hypothetical protein